MQYSNSNSACLQFPESEGSYTGEWKLDKRHGHGCMAWPCGLRYEGQFREDHRHLVTGKMTFPGGEVYEGGWVGELMHGVGTYRTEGVVFKGKFVMGSMAGEGVLVFPDGARYQGDIRDLKPTGQGHLHYPDQTQYQGQLHCGIRHGSGHLSYPNGDWYSGEWKDNLRDGYGTMHWANTKEMYEGMFAKGKRWGRGVLRNGRKEVVYDGMWREDEMEGSGVLITRA